MVLTIDATRLKWVTSYKYLCIWLDDKLSFRVHIDSGLKSQTEDRILFSYKSAFLLLIEKD